MKILANDGISEKAIKTLDAAGFKVLTTKVAQNQLANFINEEQVEILLVRSATQAKKDLIDACSSLRLIGRGGVGMDNIDVAYAREKGIKVINTPNASSHSVAELTFAHLFSGVRFLYDANRNMPLDGDTRFDALKKDYAKGQELKGKTLGIMGLGRIGKAVATIALGLGMKVIAHDPLQSEATITLSFFDGRSLDFRIQTISKETLLKEADFITLHIPAQQEVVIGEKEFQLMKDGVGIINVARGGVIDEEALLHALEHEKVAFAGLDVFKGEPTPSIRILMHPRVSLSPHIGAATLEAQERVGDELATQIIEAFGK
ncbi:D-2-hydroxyacid dehydrogenase [uncultured Capnocytophaga sp.]|jgi:phosphoglycerate dehydrogenase|uniref:D-2-hydroxyacid dehydrogenase n=1 Tax=uncultured Capnocytophaga sp. TaxID=159273 RepID=UPI0026349CAC|nr:D-2-hydroxyacid dehydrogenase [uncultured Capnocytophaga sp.]